MGSTSGKNSERLKELSEIVMQLDRCIAQLKVENYNLKERAKALEKENFSLKNEYQEDTRTLNDVICALRYELARKSD